MKIKNVVSLFDGMSGFQIAMQRLGIKPENYYASEKDKYCIALTKKHFPKTVQLGNVLRLDARKLNQLPMIDFLSGGSPCQGFSFAGNQLNFEDPRSKLFFEYVRILKILRKKNPKILFLLENVKMKKEYQDVISQQLGVKPIEINSALVSAQNRKRLYWTNIPNIKQPKDRHIYLKDVLENEVDEKYFIKTEKMLDYVMDKERLRKKYTQIGGDKAITMIERQFKSWTGTFVQAVNPKFGRTEEAKKVRRKNLASGRDSTPFAAKEITSFNVDKMATLTSSPTRDNMVLLGNIYDDEQNPQAGRVYTADHKSATISSGGGGGVQKLDCMLSSKKTLPFN